MATPILRICVIGLGYIGLPTAALLTTKGFDVYGVDVRADVVETINGGEIHICEPELDVLVKSAVNSGRLSAGTEPVPADIFILAVPTPFTASYSPDISYIQAATAGIAKHLRAGNLVILESTSPIGTTEKVARWIADQRSDLLLPSRGQSDAGLKTNDSLIKIAHCPERVLPGRVLKELVDNDRIVGGIDKLSTSAATEFYRCFVAGQILETDSRTAELAKLTENAFRDVNIAFANELSTIADDFGVDVWELIELANHHPRVNILSPGPGVGGHCIAVDPWFIISAAGGRATLMRAARGVNDSKPDYVVGKVLEHAERLKQPKIACLGLAFKADVDDLRESPAVNIVSQLARCRVGNIIAVEPHLRELPADLDDAGVRMLALSEALAEADIVLGLVDHASFKEIDPLLLKEKIVIDTRGMWQ